MLVLLAPSFPIAAAADETVAGATGFDWLPLYVTAGREAGDDRGLAKGFSSLPGDAMPSDPSTRSVSAFLAITRETSSIRLAKEDTFLVQLVSPDQYAHVRGSIAVFAVDALDQRTEIARVNYTPPAITTADMAQLLVNQALNHTMRALYEPFGPVGNAVLGHAAGQYDAIRDLANGTPFSSASGAVYEEVCGSWEGLPCRGVTGRYGVAGAFDVCRADPPEGPLVADVLWTAVDTIDETQAQATGGRVCRDPLYDDVNASAGAADGFVGGADLPPAPYRSLPPPPPSEDLPARHEWKNVTMNATVPSWFLQDDTSFVVPAGMRLALDVELYGITPTGDPHRSNVIVLEHGRADAPTALLVRHATPGAFAAFAYDAERIGMGRHTGFFANLTDADDYSLVGGEGILRLTNPSFGGLRITVYDEDGRATSSTSPVFSVPAPDLITLRIQPTSPFPATSEYTFHVELISAEGELDDGLVVGPGSYAGTLDGSDNVDHYAIFAWMEQRVNLTLAFGPEVAFRVRPASDGFHDATQANASGLSTYSGRAGWTGYFTFAVERSYGHGPYTLEVELDASGDLTQLPELVPTWEPGERRTFGAFIGDGDAVVVDTIERGGPGAPRIERIAPDGRSVLVAAAETPLAFAADGELMHIGYLSGPGRITHHAQGVQSPVSHASDTFAFLPDGSFVSTRTDGSSPRTFVVHTDTAGVETPIEAPGVREGTAVRLVTAPDGALYLVPNATSAFVVDVEARVMTPAPEAFHGVLGFDAGGRAYRLHKGSLIERVDVATGEQEIVAWARSLIGSVAVSETHLFALVEGSLAAVPMPGGFGGFRPAFTPRALPDITVDRVEELEARLVVDAAPGEERVFRVHLSNIGAADAPPHRVLVRAGCICAHPAGQYLDAPAIPAGGMASLEFVWRSVGSRGEYTITVLADTKSPFAWVDDEVVESNERNNSLYQRFGDPPDGAP